MEPEKSLLREFVNEGWIVPFVGAMGMIARLMVNPTKHSIWDFVRKVLSAAIAAGISWFILDQAPFTDFTKAICYGVVGVVSPEIINGIIALAKKFEKHPEKFITKSK